MDQKQYEQLARRVGPAGVAFVGYLRDKIWPVARAAALDMGMNRAEAEDAARTACAGAVKGFVSSINAALAIRERGNRH